MVKYTQMISTAVLIVQAVISAAFAGERVVVSALPMSAYADCESTTNVSFNARRNDVKNFAVRIELAESVSNCVQVAFGHDANGNQNLELDETALVLGWANGSWRVENAKRGAQYFEPANGGNARRSLELSVRTDANFAPRQVAFANDAGAGFTELVSTAPSFLFDRAWNLAKVTRGGEAAGEWCRIDNDYRRFAVIIR